MILIIVLLRTLCYVNASKLLLWDLCTRKPYNSNIQYAFHLSPHFPAGILCGKICITGTVLHFRGILDFQDICFLIGKGV